MKNQIFTLIVSTAVFAASPAFAMLNDKDDAPKGVTYKALPKETKEKKNNQPAFERPQFLGFQPNETVLVGGFPPLRMCNWADAAAPKTVPTNIAFRKNFGGYDEVYDTEQFIDTGDFDRVTDQNPKS